MIIKKYQGTSEAEATTKAKEDLGKDAVIMNVKTVKHKGLYRLLKKSYVEVTAAVDEPSELSRERSTQTGTSQIKPEESKSRERSVYGNLQEAEGSERMDAMLEDSLTKTSAIEERLDNLAQILERQMKEPKEEDEKTVDQNSRIIKLVFDQLVSNEVTEENAREIISEIDQPDQKLQLYDLLASVYQKIVLKLGQMKTIEPEEGKAKVVFFIGPTGVGKTTTIAKLASKFKLEQKCKLAIITADTYRIAAVEQIRTYANILSVPIDVVYNAAEIKDAIKKYETYDLIFVDTAGRSHKSDEQREDVKTLLEAVSEYEPEIYLVLSATTKYRDLIRITETYSDILNYRLLFTKIDETTAIGNILNIRMLTKEPLSYTTFGQNVPDDIEVTDAQYIAKQLLGGNQ